MGKGHYMASQAAFKADIGCAEAVTRQATAHRKEHHPDETTTIKLTDDNKRAIVS
jgi:hypothetical protein